MNIDEILESQKEFFATKKTLPVSFRIEMLRKLYKIIQKYENEINEALYEDLGKSGFESYMCEVGLTLSEISYMIRHTASFAKRKRVHTPLSQLAARSFKQPSPYGNILIMSPWNYPFLLTIEPLVDALAAGNTAIIKPSAYSPATSKIIKKIIEECFSTNYVAVITGGRKENATLLEKKFDLIFFTGSQNVGKEVLRHAAENLTPCVLELGGKSPCIVDKSANIELAAKRIVFGKYLNCGQTCVAPDYILCHSSIKNKFIEEVIKQIKNQYKSNPLENPNYGKIINEKHYTRSLNLIDPTKLIYGGKSNSSTLQIEPTVIDNVTWNDKIMQEEIFGPLMPILTYDNINEINTLLKDKPKPLAFYIFSSNQQQINELIEGCTFGGGCINDTLIHLATSEMGFGGVQESGMGSYHGLDGFNAFSHYKSIVDKKTWIDLTMRYQPYDKRYQKILHFFLK
ncbi:MAG: aldehyde dehydrogenase [Traorella sp.]